MIDTNYIDPGEMAIDYKRIIVTVYKNLKQNKNMWSQLNK